MNRRHELTDAQWDRLKGLLSPEKPETARPALSHRMMLNGMVWRAGIPWRDLPSGQEANQRGAVTWEIHFIDSTTVRAHQHAAGAKKYSSTRSSPAQLIEREPVTGSEVPLTARYGAKLRGSQ